MNGFFFQHFLRVFVGFFVLGPSVLSRVGTAITTALQLIARAAPPLHRSRSRPRRTCVFSVWEAHLRMRGTLRTFVTQSAQQRSMATIKDIAAARGELGHQFVLFVQSMVAAGMTARTLTKLSSVSGSASRIAGAPLAQHAKPGHAAVVFPRAATPHYPPTGKHLAAFAFVWSLV